MALIAPVRLNHVGTSDEGVAVVTSTADFEPYVRRLDTIPLHHTAFVANRLLKRWMDGDQLLARAGPDGSALKEMDAGSPLMRWAVAELVRHAIMWSPEVSADSPLHLPRHLPDAAKIARLVHVAASLNLESVETDPSLLDEHGPLAFMHTTIAAQRRIWRPPMYRLGQALLMYRDAIKRRGKRDPRFAAGAAEDLLNNVLGMEFEAFARLVLLLMAHSIGDVGYINDVTFAEATGKTDVSARIGLAREGLIVEPRFQRVVRLLSASPAEMVANMARSMGLPPEQRPPMAAALRAPNPLIASPLLRVYRGNSLRCIAPVPTLILDWLHEPLADLLHAAAAKNDMARNAMALAFEEFVGLALEISDPEHRRFWPEEALPAGEGEHTADWVGVFRRHALLVECKRMFVKPFWLSRAKPDDWKTAKKECLKAIAQTLGTWERIRSGRHPHLGITRNHEPLVLIVAHGDLFHHPFIEELMAAAREACRFRGVAVPLAVLPLDDFLHVTTEWSLAGDPEWLPNFLLRVAGNGRGAVQALGAIPSDGPYWRAGRDFV